MPAREKILHELEQNRGEFISGTALAKKLGVSRNAIWKSIKLLTESGYEIDAVTNKGYRLAETCDKINKSGINAALTTRYMGRKIDIFKEVNSTNTYAKEIAKDCNAVNGHAVIAECQTAGRGRMGRTFVSPFGTGIYLTVILRPEMSMDTAQLLTSCAAVAVSEAVDKLYYTDTKIKWVNDLFLNGRKYCGILTEASISFESGQLEFAVIGMGLNVKSITEKVSEEILDIATSIEDESNMKVSRNILIAEILNNLEKHISNIETREFMHEYRRRSFITGESVIVTVGAQHKNALAIGIDDNAGLIVRFEDGTEEVLNSGEARIVKA